MSLIDLENMSIVTSMKVHPLNSGRSVRKSMARCDQGLCGVGRGISLPAGKWRGTFVWAQTAHEIT